MNIHEYQAKALLNEFGVPISQRRAGAEGRGRRGRRQDAARPDLGGEEPDPCRRPRQGQVQGSLRRRQGRRPHRQVGRRGQRVRQADARRDAGHGADRRARQAGQPPLHRGRLRHRQGVLSLDPGRPRNLGSVVRGLDRRRRQHRGRRAQQPEKIVTFSVDPATGIMGHHGRTVAKALNLTGDLAKQAEKLVDAALCGLRRQGHGDAGDQSAGRHQAGPAARARRQGVVRRQRAVPSSRSRRRCATRPRRTPRRSRRRNTISTTSRSTAPSAAWSTARALPWRPWTSSSSTAWRRRTSSTSAAAPARRRSRPPSRSSPPIPT